MLRSYLYPLCGFAKGRVPPPGEPVNGMRIKLINGPQFRQTMAWHSTRIRTALPAVAPQCECKYMKSTSESLSPPETQGVWLEPSNPFSRLGLN